MAHQQLHGAPHGVPPLILASASPARLRVLRAAGLDPEVAPSAVDEDWVEASAPAAIVVELAERKARAVAEGRREGLVIGCDSLLDVAGLPFGKPHSAARASALWQRLAGEAATLHTGQFLLDLESGRSSSALVSSTIHFAEASEELIAAYVASGEPLAVAGAFTIDGLGSALVERVEGDPNGVLGLSTAALRRQLALLGYDLSAYWRR